MLIGWQAFDLKLVMTLNWHHPQQSLLRGCAEFFDWSYQ